MIETPPLLAPDASRAARTMARCHDQLAARRRKIEAQRRASPTTIAAERLLVAGLCAMYLISMAGNLLHIAGTQ